MNTSTVPHLTTALTGPFHKLEHVLLERQANIEAWFRGAWRETPAPFYASVDLRNAGYKIAPIDTNLFPAGFNNLNPAFESLCVQALQMAIERIPHPVDRILIIPENHTRNLFYLENIASLRAIMEKAGFQVRIGSLRTGFDRPARVQLDSSHTILLEPLRRAGDQLRVEGYVPDLIVLNNDLAAGRPAILDGIAQTITPPVGLGWSSRLKSGHFAYYRQVAREFARLIEIDPWLIDPLFRNCGEVDFMRREGVDCLSRNTTLLLGAIREKYAEHGVACEPFVMLKADAGTYGMGVMSVRDPARIAELNRKERARMATTKEGQKVSKVIIQEGVYTHETWGNARTVAEPVVYMLDHQVVGGFYRAHAKRSASQNLNAPGMSFEPLAFDDCCISPRPGQDLNCNANRFYTYGVVARLALLAAARELRDIG